MGGGGLFFRWGASLLSEGRGVHHGGASVLMRGFSEKIVGLRVPPHAPPTLGNPGKTVRKSKNMELQGIISA